MTHFDRALFWRMMCQQATTIGYLTSAATGAANYTTWVFTLDKMAHGDKHTGISENRIRTRE